MRGQQQSVFRSMVEREAAGGVLLADRRLVRFLRKVGACYNFFYLFPVRRPTSIFETAA
jgi:hypothetical protein